VNRFNKLYLMFTVTSTFGCASLFNKPLPIRVGDCVTNGNVIGEVLGLDTQEGHLLAWLKLEPDNEVTTELMKHLERSKSCGRG
jgi:hypothetical protein